MRPTFDAARSPVGRRHIVALGTVIVGAAAAYEFSEFIIGGNFAGLALVALGAAALAVIIGILGNWRNGVYFFLTWLLFEDFVRKFLGNNLGVYFGKDVLALFVFLSFFLAYRRRQVKFFRPPFFIPLMLFVWLGVMQIFNPGSPTVWFGLMGFKIFFLYVPMVFVGYALLNSEADLRRFFFINLILVILIVSLGIVQSILGPTFLNPGVQADDLRELSGLYRVSPITGAVAYRPTSVFVSAGRYADFIMVGWIIVLGFSAYLLLRHRRGRLLAFIGVPLVAAGAFLTASRGSFIWGFINTTATSLAFLWGAPWKHGGALRAVRAVQRVAIGVVLGMVILFYLYPDALLSRLAIYQETLAPSSQSSELQYRGWTYPIRNFLGAFDYDRWPYGYGIGTTSNGSQYVARLFHVKPIGGVESGFGTLVVEMGILGLILWVVMSGAILISAWKVVRKLKGSPWFPLGFVIFWYAFFLLGPATFGGIAPYEDFLLNAYFWLLLGLLFRLPTLGLSAQYAAEAPAAQLASQKRVT